MLSSSNQVQTNGQAVWLCRSLLAVESFLPMRYLVAANMVIPHRLGHTIKVLHCIDRYAAILKAHLIQSVARGQVRNDVIRCAADETARLVSGTYICCGRFNQSLKCRAVRVLGSITRF